MNRKLDTCARCDRLAMKRAGPGTFFYCQTTELVVPQSSNAERAMFTKVPTHCPRPDTAVTKRDKPLPPSKWEKVIVSEFEERQPLINGSS